MPEVYKKMGVMSAGSSLSEQASKVLPCVPASIENAWINIGRELHLFFTKVRNVFGNFKVLRCFEAYSSDGYPHVHILMLFTDKVFLVRRHSYGTKKGKIATKYLLNNNDRKILGEYWHSFIDVTGVKSFYSVRYILKYITKKILSILQTVLDCLSLLRLEIMTGQMV